VLQKLQYINIQNIQTNKQTGTNQYNTSWPSRPTGRPRCHEQKRWVFCCPTSTTTC